MIKPPAASDSNPAAPPPRARRPKRKDVRRGILDAAVPVLAQKGMDKATLDDVAAAAGFTKGAVYSNFSTKDDLLFAILQDQISVRFELAKSVIESIQDADDIPHHIGRVLTEGISNQRPWHVLFFEFWVRANRDESFMDEFRVRRHELMNVITDAIKPMLPESPDLESRARQMATVALALSNGLVIEKFIDESSVPDDLYGDALTALLEWQWRQVG